jgi:hypothetical protein
VCLGSRQPIRAVRGGWAFISYPVSVLTFLFCAQP